MEPKILENENFENESNKNSVLGIISFIISLVAGISLIGLLAVSVAMESINQGNVEKDTSKSFILGLLLICILFLEFIAFGLGIGGLFQKNSKKLLAILGIVFSSMTVLAFCALVVIGMMSS